MPHQAIEKNQVFIYAGAILSGLVIGAASPPTGAAIESALWPVLGLLLYATFTQVPLAHLRDAFADARFLMAATLGNFVVLPVVVGGLMVITPADPALRLGVLMVLLMPCTDWFITFTQLGGGDTRRAIAFSPISLLLQIILLPGYLWLFLGDSLAIALNQTEMLTAFLTLILLPLFAAFLTEQWVERNLTRAAVLRKLAGFPVPLLALVVFIIAASQVSLVMDSGRMLGSLLIVFVAFLAIAGITAKLLAIFFQLPPRQGRVLAFSFGTRNSFVVLPLALALPPSLEMTTVVIVFQSLVELFGMATYLWWVPRRLFPPLSNAQGFKGAKAPD